MPDTDHVLRDRPSRSPAGTRTVQQQPEADAIGRRRSGRGAEVAVRALWLALGFALGVSAGLLWAGSVIAGG